MDQDLTDEDREVLARLERAKELVRSGVIPARAHTLDDLRRIRPRRPGEDQAD